MKNSYFELVLTKNLQSNSRNLEILENFNNKNMLKTVKILAFFGS